MLVSIECGVEWRHSKIILGSKSRDPEYDLKKAH
jgi:hypothetical protein